MHHANSGKAHFSINLTAAIHKYSSLPLEVRDFVKTNLVFGVVDDILFSIPTISIAKEALIALVLTVAGYKDVAWLSSLCVSSFVVDDMLTY